MTVTVYVLPKKMGFGQAINIKDVGLIHENLDRLFSDITSGAEISRLSIDLRGNEYYGSLKYAESMLEPISKEFGPPTSTFHAKPNPLGNNNVSHEWTLDSSSLDKAFDFMIQCHPWPRFALDPLLLYVGYNFNWKDSFAPCDYMSCPKENNQRFGIHIKRKLFIQPALKFPFNVQDPRLIKCMTTIESYGLFTFKREYLKQRLNKPFQPTRNARG